MMGLRPSARRAICERTGKDRMSKGEAKSMAKRQQSRASAKLRAYRCPFCAGWHIGKLVS
jgi:hypothetical protein